MIINIMTLFPEMYQVFVDTSIIGRAVKNNLLTINLYNIRDYSKNKHKSVDDYVYGGGNGMLMMCQPICDCYKSFYKSGSKTIYMSPKGKILNDAIAREFAKEEEINILCGHYEGVDERALEIMNADSISIGDFVLTGGEIASQVFVDAVARHIKGVLSNDESHDTESFCNNLLEYPQYTRPEIYEGKEVPEILLSGNHKKIDEWRLQQSVEITKKNRPDMYERYLKK